MEELQRKTAVCALCCSSCLAPFGMERYAFWHCLNYFFGEVFQFSIMNLNIIGWKKSEFSVAFAKPPTLVHHFYVGYHIIRIERYFIIRSCLVIIQCSGSDTVSLLLLRRKVVSLI